MIIKIYLPYFFHDFYVSLGLFLWRVVYELRLREFARNLKITNFYKFLCFYSIQCKKDFSTFFEKNFFAFLLRNNSSRIFHVFNFFTIEKWINGDYVLWLKWNVSIKIQEFLYFVLQEKMMLLSSIIFFRLIALPLFVARLQFKSKVAKFYITMTVFTRLPIFLAINYFILLYFILFTLLFIIITNILLCKSYFINIFYLES